MTLAADDHIRALPKIELHVHVEGAATPATVADLARHNGVDLGVEDPADLYDFVDLADFLRTYDVVCSCLVGADDFRRVTYEALALAANAGVVYREMFFSPTFVMRRGVAFDTLWDGISAGIREAESDHGIVCRMILDVDKPSGQGAAFELVERAASCDRDLLIGVGGDAGELDVDLAVLAAPFARARQLGLRTTMHLGEEGPVDDIRVGIDIVGVERVDHGFSLIDDADLVRRFADERIPVTACPTSNRCIGLIDAVADHPLLRLRNDGVLVTLNSDNAAMFRIDLADELVNVRDAFGCTLEELEDFALAGIESSWLDESAQASYRSDFVAAMNRLRVERGHPRRFGSQRVEPEHFEPQHFDRAGS